MRRLRILHKEPGDKGYICQVKKWYGWSDLGILTDRWQFISNFESCTGTLAHAKKRMEHEIDCYRREQAARRERQEFKPKVIEEWP